MARVTVDQILRDVPGASLAWDVRRELVFTSITNHSRTVQPGGLFLAIEAERDGHNYIPEARTAGASGVLARRQIDAADWLTEDERGNFAYFLVEDPILALQQVAAAHRERHDVGIIGVVGSVGKTSTKEAIAQVLRRQHRLLASPGNFNNEIGLPITLLELDESYDRAILEMGAYHVGEIARLCEIARPQMAVLTTIGPTHLESFGSLDAIEQGKGEVVEALPETGLAVLNGDDERVRRMALRAACPIALYGLGEANTVRAVNIETRGLGGIAFDLLFPGGSVRVESPLIGRHSVYACLAAAAVALADEMEPTAIAAALAESPTRLRLKPLPGKNGATILDDSYNAAPISTRAALDVLAEHTGRRVAILADMLELGDLEEEGHRSVGRHAIGRADLLFAVGERARWIGEETRAGGVETIVVDTPSDIEYEPAAGDLVLVKGSRSMRLETVVARLVDETAQ